MKDLEIILTDVNVDLVASWNKGKHLVYNTRVLLGPFQELAADAIVAPGNSFALMDGGVDLILRDEFGFEIQDQIAGKATEVFGMPIIPVGTAIAQELPRSKSFRYVIYTPTMEVPMNIVGTVNAYLATRAALFRADQLGIHSIVFMGMGALTGGLTSSECASQMLSAIKDFQNISQLEKYTDWDTIREIGTSIHV